MHEEKEKFQVHGNIGSVHDQIIGDERENRKRVLQTNEKIS